jgi:hypothetical protein
MPRPVPAARRDVRISVVALVAAGLMLAPGCGVGEPRSIDPAGVDGLEIPTSSPDPADFVTEIDNPYLPFVPGSVWHYEVVEGDEVIETVEVRATDDTREVAGVATTVVNEVVKDASGAVIEDTYEWYAQDTKGNVWSFGETTTSFEEGVQTTDGSWEAGTDGARAGLAMAARPRVGDGYYQEFRPGVAEDRAEVVALDVTRGEWTGLVETRDTTPLEPGVEEHRFYAEGLGLVLEEGETETITLVSSELG